MSTKTGGKSKKKLSPGVAKAHKRVGMLMVHLREKGIPVRLLAALLGTSNYTTVYDYLVKFTPELEVTGGRRGVPLHERAALKDLRQRWPDIFSAMDKRKITPRKWCTMYGFLKKINGRPAGADLDAVIDPEGFFDWHSKDSMKFLKYDFPEAFDPSELDFDPAPFTWARIDIAKIREEDSFKKHDERVVWEYKCDELDIRVTSYIMNEGIDTFKKWAYKMIAVRRMEMIADLEYVTYADVDRILAWRPMSVETVKKRRKLEDRSWVVEVKESLMDEELDDRLKKEIDKIYNNKLNFGKDLDDKISAVNESRKAILGRATYWPKGYYPSVPSHG